MDNTQITTEEADRMLLEAFNETAPLEEAPPVEVATPEAVEEVQEAGTPEEIPAPVQDDWISQIPDTLRDKVKEQLDKLAAAEQRIRSDDGRVAAFQRKADTLALKLQELSKLKPQETTAAIPPPIPEKWKEVADNDPELAAAIEARVKAEIQEFKDTHLKPLVQRQETQDELARVDRVTHETQLLERAIPNAREMASTPMFRGWLENEASPSIKAAFEHSLDHRDYITVFNQFALDMINTGRVAPEDAPLQAAPAATTQAVSPQKALEIAEQRARKLAAGPVVGRGVITPATIDPNKPITIEEAEAILRELYK